MNPVTIFAAAYTDDDQTTIRLFHSLAGATRWKEEIAKDWWDCHFTDPLPTDKTDQEIADHYFSYAPEYFEVRLITEINP